MSYKKDDYLENNLDDFVSNLYAKNDLVDYSKLFSDGKRYWIELVFPKFNNFYDFFDYSYFAVQDIE